MTAVYDVDGAATSPGSGSFADKTLRAAAALWFLVAAAGQWLFVYYIVAFFYWPTLTGDFAQWDRNKMMEHGYVPGDTHGNLAFATHVLLAAIITAGATLQLVPQIRKHAIGFHRWNGRLIILTALVMSLSGLFMNLTRGDKGVLGEPAITLNAALLVLCALQAFAYVRAGDIEAHRRWALRAFMLMNGVWFLRVGMSAWMAIKVGVFGAPAKLDANFFAFWGFGSYLVPLAVLELYFRAERQPRAAPKFAVATLLVLLAAATGVGVAGVFLFFWLPLIS